MAQRLQIIDGDAVLEITENETTKRRISESAVRRRITYLEDSIERFTDQLAEANAELALVTTAKDEQAKR